MSFRSERNAWLADHILPHEVWLRRSIARHAASCGMDVDDLVQESYAILIRLPSIETIRDPRRYALQVARSILLQQVRRARIVPIDAIADMVAFDPAADLPDPEEQAAGWQELNRVAEAIAAMPEPVRKAFWLRRVEGLSQREVASKLSLSENTVEKQIARGIKILAGQFSRGGNTVAHASKLRATTPESRPTDVPTRDRR